MRPWVFYVCHFKVIFKFWPKWAYGTVSPGVSCYERTGWIINLFSRLDDHLQYDILSAFSFENTRNVNWNSICIKCYEKHRSNAIQLGRFICFTKIIMIFVEHLLRIGPWVGTPYQTPLGGNSVPDTPGWYGTLGHGWACHISLVARITTVTVVVMR